MRTPAHPARTAWLVIAGLLALMLLLAGCGGGGSSSGGEELTELGKGEGQVNLISWAGYVEPEWVKPFEAKTGCKVNDKVAGTSDEMVQLMRTGQYDGVSASGNATARLVDGGDVAPVNVSLVPNYKTVFSDLKDQPYNTFDGTPYGIPHGRGANLLMWNSDDSQAGADLLGRDARPEEGGQVQGQDQRLRRPDLHRRRGRLPEDAPARTGDRRPLRAERRTVRSGGRTCSRNSAPTSANTGPTRRSRSPPSPTATAPSARPGSTSTSPCRKKASRWRRARRARASCRRRGRPAGRTPG